MVVLDHENLIQGHADVERLGLAFEEVASLRLLETASPLAAGEALRGNAELMLAEAPVLHPGGEPIGRALVGQQSSYAAELVAARRTEQLLVVGMVLGLSLVLLLLLMSKLLRPVGVLRSGIERIGRGDLDTPVDLTGRTEFTLLAEAVNEMAGELKAAQSEMVEKERLAHELGLPLEDCRVKPGEHRRAPYTDLNPYGMIPAVQWRGQTFIESTATCTFLVAPGEPDRASYLQWCALFAETLESRLVEHLLAKVEILPAAFLETTTPSLDLRLPVMLGQLPESGFLAADRFTLADIEASYSLRLAISAGLLELDAVGGYLRPLMERPAAQAAKFFSSIEPKE